MPTKAQHIVCKHTEYTNIGRKVKICLKVFMGRKRHLYVYIYILDIIN